MKRTYAEKLRELADLLDEDMTANWRFVAAGLAKLCSDLLSGPDFMNYDERERARELKFVVLGGVRKQERIVEKGCDDR